MMKRKLIVCMILWSFHSLHAASDPLFWKAVKGDETIALLGTVHSGRKTFYPLPNTIEDSLRSSKALLLEIDLSTVDSEEVHKKIEETSGLPKGESLFRLLSSDLYFKLDERLAEFKLQIVEYEHKKPWYFIFLLLTLESGIDPEGLELGVDLYLTKQAKRLKKEVIPLESVESQMQIFSELSRQDQLELIDVMLEKPFDRGQTKRDLRRLQEAWEKGDRGAIDRHIEKSKGASPIEKKFMQRINHQRNAKMLDAIIDHSKTHKQVFVAVGTMHLLGKEGLIENLKTAGFTVELVGKVAE
jgi:uncharacterized protein YbaP (TraB family)